MRCSCCDRVLSDKEVVWNNDIKSFELCGTCLDIAMDAAYSNGFHTEDDEFVVLDERFDDDQYYLPFVEAHSEEYE